MGERHALLIGMDFFQDDRLSRLLAPKEDVLSLREALLEPKIGAFDTAEVFFNSDLVPIQTALHNLFDNRSPDDLLLLYYTGHGLIDKSGELYLSLHNSNAKTPSIGSLEADFVRKWMKESHAEAQIVVLDCCHSGAFMAGAKRAVDQLAVTQHTFDTGGKGQYILSACTATEFAFEAGELRHGDPDARPRSIFTECFVKGLKTGDAAPQNAAITIDALYHYTRAQVLERKMPMDPQRWISGGSGELVLAKNQNIRIPVPEALREELIEGSKLGRLGAIEALSKMMADEKNLYQAEHARDILEEGLKAPEWVDVQKAIEAALDSPKGAAGAENWENERVGHPVEPDVPGGQVHKSLNSTEQPTKRPDRRLSWILAGGVLGAVVCLLGVYIWWTLSPLSKPTILTALRTENKTLRDKISRLEQEVREVNVANAEALRQAAEAREEVDETKRENTKLTELGAEKDKQIESLSEVRTKNEKLKEQVEDLERSLANLSETQDASLKTISRLEADKSLLLQTIEDLKPVLPQLSKDSVTPVTSWPNAEALSDFDVLREKLSDGSFAPDLVVMPAGKFLMGSPQDEESRIDSEDDTPGEGGAQVAITFLDRFAIGRTEVTFSEWDACVSDGGCSNLTPKGSQERGEHPVVGVSWKDAQSYVAWLNKKVSGYEFKPYSLPTEAQWEYAARAGSTTRFNWGDHWDASMANGRRVTGSATEVGSYPANNFGLFDMHGNVWEWVADAYQYTLSGVPTDGTQRQDESESSNRVIRGGSWNSFPRNLRSAVRVSKPSGIQLENIGFRLVRALTP